MRAPARAVAAVLGPLLVALAAAGAAAAQAPTQKSDEQSELCQGCHGDRGLTMKLPSGETVSLHVDQQAWARSVHGDKLGCVDCHGEMTEVPHARKPFTSRRQFTIAYYEQCKRCHFANYTKSLDSVHFQRVARGDPGAPVCVDCHTAHAITRPDVPRSRISQTCAKCHREISAAYGKSVHGRALLEEDNRDVPVCTDCHRSHNIADPRTRTFLLSTPELCGNCHTNERIMRKYGLSTRVLTTYLGDFHGVTAAFHRDQPRKGAGLTAVCIDCHGFHDITKVREPGSRVMQANLVRTCRQCHPDATDNFPAAWLSHYEPSWQKAPLVYAITLFYKVFIPFVIGGLMLQILLHLWRVVVNR
jgi:predicted CXXCH cytochrome family protein